MRCLDLPDAGANATAHQKKVTPPPPPSQLTVRGGQVARGSAGFNGGTGPGRDRVPPCKHSIPIPGDDRTWDDFERIAADIHAKEGIYGAGSRLYYYTPEWKAVYLSTWRWTPP